MSVHFRSTVAVIELIDIFDFTVIMSDWYGTASTLGSISGLDVGALHFYFVRITEGSIR